MITALTQSVLDDLNKSMERVELHLKDGRVVIAQRLYMANRGAHCWVTPSPSCPDDRIWHPYDDQLQIAGWRPLPDDYMSNEWSEHTKAQAQEVGDGRQV